MEKGSARLFQQATCNDFEQSWNIVELETRKQVRQQINTLLYLTHSRTVTTSEMRRLLLKGVATFGNAFATQLVRSLQRDDPIELQSVVWLLTILNDKGTVPPLQQMARSQHLPRAVRLSAALALAGMGMTAEMLEQERRVRLYALS
ncbi:MAG TPA: hypothetical protein VFV38_40605 [Ktedonobacteraceae bacterium]|nr:hypothetical protein [Ktedonobacteraceae bacterium]